MRGRGLDEKDLKLLSILKRNSRASYSYIARELGITESAVRKRIKRLVRLGVVRRFTLEYRIPGSFTAVILVRTNNAKPVPQVAERIAAYMHVEKVMEVTGDYDIIAIATAQDIEDINRLIDYIRGIEGVHSTYTMIVLREH
ncbi:HTH-type transcriptional regulator LysM [Aeropyrum pernix K1]|uniref:HTH-type transcriptional regulator LysM n=1 Tax=Aeropyrum pernix (strain ATCC 700893 / DSM 11879 / JCM 9820 / NBRC 100138 / K1) TaxID=272557 RepID=Q05E09_AERPE|nr:HTH-type transcriptional regulator LysM [Aeropyrum pernix]BAF34792.1 HTH-type transcriptional regulator LysM [Aeropyrum pernix K1]